LQHVLLKVNFIYIVNHINVLNFFIMYCKIIFIIIEIVFYIISLLFPKDGVFLNNRLIVSGPGRLLQRPDTEF